MRLADQIIERAAKPRTDADPLLQSLATALRAAVPFQIEAPVGAAACQIADSSIKHLIDARRFAKAPFRSTWIEWDKSSAQFNVDPLPPEPGKEEPRRSGVQIETDDSHQRGAMSWAWEMPSFGPIVTLFSMLFDWSEHPQPIPDLIRANHQLHGVDWGSKITRDYAGPMRARLGGATPEQAAGENLRWGIVPSRHATDMWKPMAVTMRLDPAAMRSAIESQISDIEGEAPFAQALLVCLNSRNLLRVEAPPDMTKLNRARAKRGATPLLSFSTVKLDLSRVAQRKVAASAGAGDMRAHLVRGHFKIRKSGVFWWSPFVRGDAAKGAVGRAGYKVAA